VAIDRARETIRHLSRDSTSTMMHGDLHFGNILPAVREPWLTIDPKGWAGTAAYDAFTVMTGRPEDLDRTTRLNRALTTRVRRFASAAHVDADLALACCQARATSGLSLRFVYV